VRLRRLNVDQWAPKPSRLAPDDDWPRAAPLASGLAVQVGAREAVGGSR